MAPQRFGDRPRTRKPGAGRPRNVRRVETGPVDVEIIGAAARLFARDGVAATTMAEIADEVGLGVSSIYYYFRNKHDLLERIVIDVNQVPLKIAERARLDHPSAGQRLHSFIRNDAIALCQLPFDINEIHRLAGQEPDAFERYWADRDRLLAEVSQFVVEGVSSGEFRTVEPELTGLTVLANDEAIQNWYRPGLRRQPGEDGLARFEPAEIGLHLADLTLRGLLADPTDLSAIRRATGPGRTAR